jgi:DNA-binding transcriptional MerR regulator
MRQTSKVEGTKIAQAAKDLNVTSVTIRRYLNEFNIEPATDENGIKVLPDMAMEELKLVRKLKEDGLTNPEVLEQLEKSRAEGIPVPAKKERVSRAAKPKVVEEPEESEEEVAEEAPKPVDKRRGARRIKPEEVQPAAESVEEAPGETDTETEAAHAEGEGGDESGATDANGDARPKHSLTCQTCGKVFEHMNPRLRDCLDCYRTKRKERRRGGSDRHKNVIQHPLAQQAVSKAAQQQNQQLPAEQPGNGYGERIVAAAPMPVAPTYFSPPPQQAPTPVAVQSAAIKLGPVRNYRKAIEETRQITGSLKRRLERPDLPEGERRWLEQIYAYQLILHQGWRHLSDYKNNTPAGAKTED